MRSITAFSTLALLAMGGIAAAQPAPAPGRPIDRGPFTPEASRAYQGGGVVLEGKPGEPAPTPQATPPGQVPANSVKP